MVDREKVQNRVFLADYINIKTINIIVYVIMTIWLEKLFMIIKVRSCIPRFKISNCGFSNFFRTKYSEIKTELQETNNEGRE